VWTVRAIAGLALAASVTGRAYAQAPLEDASGGSTILLNASSVSVNSADGSIQLAFEPFSSTKPIFYGFKVKGKAEGGLATLFSSGELTPGIEIGTTVGFKLGDGGNAWGLAASLNAAQLTLYDEAAPLDEAIVKETRHTGEVSALANFIFEGVNGNKLGLASVAVRGRHRNNWDSLKKTTVVVHTPRGTSTEGVVTETVKETEVRTGTFEEGWIGEVAGDLMFFASRARLSPRVYTRIGVTGKDALRDTRIGFDLAFVKFGGDPVFNRLGSIFLEYVNPAAKDEPGDWTVGLSVNVPFSLFN
jgi:hypothetical protein